MLRSKFREIFLKVCMAAIIGLMSIFGSFSFAGQVHASTSSPYLGEIKLFPYTLGGPEYWIYCDGRILSIAQNAALFSLLGTQYGGDGRTTFAIPDLRDVEPVDGVGYYLSLRGIYPSRDGDGDYGNSFTGDLSIFPYYFAPGGTRAADGSLLDTQSHQALFEQYGYTFGGDEQQAAFNLPMISPIKDNVKYYVTVQGDYPSDVPEYSEDYVGEVAQVPAGTPLSSTIASQFTSWERADGRLVDEGENSALYSLILGKFGADGETTLPDLSADTSIEYYLKGYGIYPSSSGSIPVANADSYTTNQNTLLTIGQPGILSNDVNTQSGVLLSLPEHGTLTYQTNGSFSYTPAAGYYGNDSFVYKASNSSMSSKRVIVALTVVQTEATITGITNGGIYKEARTISFGDNPAILDGQPFASGDTVSEEGVHALTITLTSSGIIKTYNFTIDKTAPIVTGVVNNELYNSVPSITFNEGTALLDNLSFLSGNAVSAPGIHTLVVTDAAGNSTTIQFTINVTKTVSFVSNGGTAVASQTVNNNSKATIPSSPTRSQYTFQGWYKDILLSVPYDFETVVTADTTLYAKWVINSYTLSFASNGGTAIGGVTVTYNTAASKPADPTRAGHTFGGWYIESALTNAYDFTTLVTSNKTLYAKWTVENYTVSFNSNGGSAVADVTAPYNTVASKPTDPTRAGHTFGGWYTESGLTNAYDFTALVTSNKTLYAKWTVQNYTVSFNSNGGSAVADVTAPYNTAASKPADPTRAGHIFGGWYTESALTNAYDFTTLVTANTALYAKWTVENYTVSFNSNGGSAIADVTAPYNTAASKPADPTRAGHTFGGWYTESALTNAYDFTALVTANTTLYAKWTVENYTVSFNSNGGSAIADVTAPYNTAASKPADPTKAGHTFGGWYTESALTNAYDFTALVTSNKTLYAKWTVENYTVSFNSNGGSAVADVTAPYNTAASKPTDPTRAGHIFGGWYTESGLTNAYDFTTLVTANTTLYAKWTVENYTLSFNSNGGSAIADVMAPYNTAASKPADPTRAGHTFGGWYTESALTNAYDFTALVTANTTLYAKWTVENYTVSFNSNGGSAVADVTAPYNTAASKPADPTKAGHTFGGWYTESALTNAYDFTALVTANTALYAKWTVENYTVSFNSNGGSAVADVTAPYNTAASKPTDPTRAGHIFGGWYTESALTNAYDFTTLVTANTTLYAKWTVENYTLSFNSNGGSAVADVTAPYNTVASKPTDPTRAGHTFGGWYTESGLTNAYDFTALVTSNKTLYAKWTVENYTVSFNSNGGSAVADVTAPYNTAASKPADPTRAGHTFGGWYTESGLTNAYDFTTLVTANTTLYAKWTIENYTVSFNSNGGSAIADVTAPYNTAASKPADPTRAGHIFGGWYTESALTNAYDFTTLVTANTTLYAKWTAIANPDVPVTSTPDTTGPTPSTTNTAAIKVDGLNIEVTPIPSTTSDGRKVSNITVDSESLDNAIASNENSAIKIEISNNDPVVILQLPVNSLLKTSKPETIIEIKVNEASYFLPVSILKNVSPDAVITITISKVSEQSGKEVIQAITLEGAEQLLANPVDFSMKQDGEEITDFNGAYVDRSIELPLIADLSTTTAVWVDANLELHFVPSVFSENNGKMTVSIHSPHNSIYTVVQLNRTFTDLQGHWAKADIELLANKLIVKGVTEQTFAPDSPITRAEFAALLVRSLGLVEVAPEHTYTDVSASDWFYNAVGAAQQAGLVTGLEDGSFQPNEKITREQMAVMIMRAINFAGKETASDMSLLKNYTDHTSVAGWAEESVAETLTTGILNGMTEKTLGVHANATRAQSAVMLKRMLQYLEFIN